MKDRDGIYGGKHALAHAIAPAVKRKSRIVRVFRVVCWVAAVTIYMAMFAAGLIAISSRRFEWPT
jgi:hypothetical protein